MVSSPWVPKRGVHLDFHTSPFIRSVAEGFDKAAFAKTFERANVDTVNVFAKCHHGHLYYDTNRPERHPSLPRDLDLLREQVEALHGVGIKAPIYVSIQCDEYAADLHPEWVALGRDRQQITQPRVNAVEAGWRILDMASPYQDYVAAQLTDVLQAFPEADGFWLDMCWDQPSFSTWMLQHMEERGLDPSVNDDGRAAAKIVSHDYMSRFRDLINSYHRGSAQPSIFFNSRPRLRIPEELGLATHQEIEALPTGGWGYDYAPFIARFVRTQPVQMVGMVGRFHAHWGDNGGLHSAAALKYECMQLLSLGSGLSIGDSLPPDGAARQAVYDLIGDVYGYARDVQQLTEGMSPQTEVAVLLPDLPPGTRIKNMGEAIGVDVGGPDVRGAVRLLQQTGQQFDFLAPESSFDGYRALVVLSTTTVDEVLRARLQSFADGGGGIIFSGPGFDADGSALIPAQGVRSQGASPYSHAFMRAEGSFPGVPEDFDMVMYERGAMVVPDAGSEVLFRVVEPHFERSARRFSGHEYTPSSGIPSEQAAVTLNGRVATISFPLIEAYGRQAPPLYRPILRSIVERVLPDPLVRFGGPAHVETSYLTDGDRVAVHLVSYIPSRHGYEEEIDVVHDPVPVVDAPVSVRFHGEVSQVRLEPGGHPIPYHYDGSYVHVSVTFHEGHSVVVIS